MGSLSPQAVLITTKLSHSLRYRPGGQQTFSAKGQIVNIFCRPYVFVFVFAATQLCVVG